MQENALIMARAIFAFILLVHGLIHLMGFAKAFKLAEIQQLTHPISKTNGALWLLSAVLFVAATALFLLKKDIWWMVAVPALMLSQALIFIYWQDAKFGTIANVIILIGIVLAWAAWDFNTKVHKELNTFLQKANTPQEIITKDQIVSLPPIIQTWLEHADIIGKERIQTIHLHQKGMMRTSPNGKWMPVQAEQYFTTDPPGFIWIADVKMMPFVSLSGRDKYEDGKGSMLIKMLSLVPIANAKGAETDQGAMLRYLAETVWFPTAALSKYITWEAIDSTSAKATMMYGDIKASGIFTFNKDGDLTSFEADRYYDRKGGATLERWRVECSDHRELGGIRIPIQSKVAWKLKEGDFNWFNLQITGIEYNLINSK